MPPRRAIRPSPSEDLEHVYRALLVMTVVLQQMVDADNARGLLNQNHMLVEQA